MKRTKSKLVGGLRNILNGYNLRKKFFLLYFFCVLTPLFLTDWIIVKSFYSREESSIASDMDYVANLYKNEIANKIESDMKIASSINMNTRITDLLNKQYKDPYEYYDQYYDIIDGSYLQSMIGLTSDSVCVYADNDTILDSMYFKKMTTIKDTDWYKDFIASGHKSQVFAYYDEDIVGQRLNRTRRFFYVSKMDHDKSGCDKIIVIENDANDMAIQFKKIGEKYNVCIIVDDYLMFSNQGGNIYTVDELPETFKNPHVNEFEYKGCTCKVYITPKYSMMKSVLTVNAPIIIVLIIFTIVIPYFALKVIEKNIISRILKLENAFKANSEKAQDDAFIAIEDIEGTDEISGLMKEYNEMVDFTNELMNTVYKDKLRKQENDIARKNAELLALQSQINPHFLFNALESIRMHSLLKGEEETSVMVGKLAVMQRQNVEWGDDFVSVKKEMESIEAYLYLQGYRFGERLSFEIDMDEDCANYLIPKLTIVTFVENACVHGIEMKATPGWIFVRTYKKDQYLVIEVEDTGGGMSEDEVKTMLDNITNVTIDAIKGKKHVGILNACLRLKMITDNTVSFSIDSEEGIGMSMEIKIPLDKLGELDEKEAR